MSRNGGRRSLVRGESDPEEGRTPSPSGIQRLARGVLRVPLFYKVLVANALLVVLAAAGGSWITARLVRSGTDVSPGGAALLVSVGALLISLAVNALILRLALVPLRDLEKTARSVAEGAEEVRAPVSPVADENLERLILTFNRMLDRLADYRVRLRRLASRTLQGQEEERKRIARELHDDTAQRLAAHILDLGMTGHADSVEEVRPRLISLREELEETLVGLRRYARGLRPPTLDELDLVNAVRAHVRELSEAERLEVDLEAEALGEELSPEVELTLYRIVQEALRNVHKHSGARRARVEIGTEEDVLRVSVEDRGRGFEPRRPMEEGEGLGLFGMKERAAFIGGRAEIRSRRGEGTRVEVTVPFRRARSLQPVAQSGGGSP